MKTRYFVRVGMSPNYNLSDIPEGSIIGDHPGARVDYENYSHELREDCDCRHCIDVKLKGGFSEAG